MAKRQIVRDLLVAGIVYLHSGITLGQGVTEAWIASYNGPGNGREEARVATVDDIEYVNSVWQINDLLTKGYAFYNLQGAGGSHASGVCSVCGDANGDGIVDPADMILLRNYMFFLQSLVCPDQADIDDYESITMRDLVWLVNYRFQKPGCGGWRPTCPPGKPPLQPVLLPADTLLVGAVIIPPGESTAAIHLEYKNIDTLVAVVLPLKILVGIEIPVINKAISGPRFPNSTTIVDTGTGEMLYWFTRDGFVGPGSDTMLTVYLSFESSTFERGVSIDTTGFSPGHHPLFLGPACLNPVLPILCFAGPADADANGNYTLADVVAIVNFVFNKPGCSPQPLCWLSGLLCRGEVNGSAPITTADVVYLINYVFDKDRPATSCVDPDPGTCWPLVPTDVCCLPVP